jgi:peptide/nickel transport system substrate-binding protein
MATPLRTTSTVMRQAGTWAAVVALAGCTPSEGSRGAIEVLVSTGPQTLDPRFSTDATAMRVTRLVHAGLVRLDATTLEPVPYAASELTWLDATHLAVKLRPDVRFASGAPLEPEDVCETLAAVGDLAMQSPHRSIVSNVLSCTRTGPRELVLAQREARVTLITDLEIPILRRDEARSAPRPDGGLDGLGPYAISSASHEAIQLKARADSALGRTPGADVTIRIVHDENARAVRLLAGRADVIPNGLSPVLLDAVEKKGARVATRPGANLTYLAVSGERVPSAEARRGLGEALDRETLARALFGGRARVARSVLPPSSWAYAEVDELPFSPASARERLARAGVKKLTLLVSTDRARGLLARSMAQMLGDVGVEVEVVPLELGVLIHRLTAGDFELAILQMPEITEPDLLRWFFHSASIPTKEGGGVGANRVRYSSAAVDSALSMGRQSRDRDVRRVAYAQAQHVLARDLPVVPLFHEDQIAALSPRALAFLPSAEGRWLSLADIGPP